MADCVVDAHALLGEGPLWRPDTAELIWLDINGRRLHRFNPETGHDTDVELARRVGAVAERDQGGLVAATEDGFAWLDPRTGGLTRIVPDFAVADGLRMNDGKCDPDGRFWAGTMADTHTAGAGALYRLDADRTVRCVIDGVTLSNGIDWTADGRTMYYIDSFAHGVDAFDVNLHTGELDNRRRLVDITNDTSGPAGFTVADGMTLDVVGNLWVAIHGLGEVHCLSPDGQLVETVEVPSLGVTSVAFGGGDLGDLFITTAAEVLSDGHPLRQQYDGGLFRCRPGAHGRRAHRFAG